jgi:hypothetical protein
MDITSVVAQIVSAFPERPIPTMTLRQGQLGDQTMTREISEDEWRREGERDCGVIWTQVDESTLRECDSALCFLDEEAFVYYLPAYLCAALRSIAAGRSESNYLVNGAVFHVTNTRDNWALARLKRLSDRQIDAVINFLRVVRDQCPFEAIDAGDALVGYWETPESRRRTLIYVP